MKEILLRCIGLEATYQLCQNLPRRHRLTLRSTRTAADEAPILQSYSTGHHALQSAATDYSGCESVYCSKLECQATRAPARTFNPPKRLLMSSSRAGEQQHAAAQQGAGAQQEDSTQQQLDKIKWEVEELVADRTSQLTSFAREVVSIMTIRRRP